MMSPFGSWSQDPETLLERVGERVAEDVDSRDEIDAVPANPRRPRIAHVRERSACAVEGIHVEADATTRFTHLPRDEATNLDAPFYEQLGEPHDNGRLPHARPAFDQHSDGHESMLRARRPSSAARAQR